jgi:peptidyl-dipeptidase Dcp
MRIPTRIAGTLAVFLLASAAKAEDPAAAPMTENPFFSESTLAFHYPPFDKIKDSDYAPAFERGMSDQLAEIDAIAANADKPTFDNTIVAMERSGRLYGRVAAVFDDINQCNTDDELQAVQTDMAPKRSAHNDAIYLNAKLFARVRELYDERASLGLDPESLRLLEKYHEDFVLAGANLSPGDQQKLRSLNSRIAALETTFSQNTLKEKNASTVFVKDRAELAGLLDAEVSADAQAAKDDHHDGEYAIAIKNTTGQPVLESLQNRALRERIMAVSQARGSHGGPFDNQQTVAQLTRARAEKGVLLGFDNFAAYRVANQTARTVSAIDGLLSQLVGPAVAKSKREAADMQAIVDREHGGFQIDACDWEMYSEKVRQEKYAFDESQLRPYFELNSVLFNGVFFAANKLYGITFKERHDLPVYQPDVRVFQVYDSDGKPLAILLEDFYARPSKQGGAWMNEFVSQSGLFGYQAVIGNHHNIPKPAAGEPTLLTFDEVVTLFHEFGHGLHGLFSNVKYPYFAGTQVPRDFVEYPSQVNEMWADFPDVLRNYAKHYKTGETIPQPLLDKVLAAEKFGQGFATLEYLKATLLDQAWHTLKPDQVPTDVPAMEAATFKKYGADFGPVPPRYHSTYFSHAMTADYAAGYYSYIWADVLVADSIDWFKSHGGLLRSSGDHFRATVLSHGGSVEAMDLFRDFTGSGPDVGPLIRRRGLDEGGN